MHQLVETTCEVVCHPLVEARSWLCSFILAGVIRQRWSLPSLMSNDRSRGLCLESSGGINGGLCVHWREETDEARVALGGAVRTKRGRIGKRVAALVVHGWSEQQKERLKAMREGEKRERQGDWLPDRNERRSSREVRCISLSENERNIRV
ncbi:hypothetical protein HAX54_027676 [Datura stramonium]|uniref:Uncharacterized protein n=1 Tax=Datura stramonium TaxID=4076 RepID=A0ABS8V442_DATST|nr:hypothetical protein [Datura stramonium]